MVKGDCVPMTAILRAVDHAKGHQHSAELPVLDHFLGALADELTALLSGTVAAPEDR